jgi:hypothetical protein
MTLGSHQKTVGDSQTYITPKWIIDALGPFDLDPCAADPRPWDCAARNYTEADALSGLDRKWTGRIWLNPPFDRFQVGQWIEKLSLHPDGGIALLHARTETEWFRPIWQRAGAVRFLFGRITFCKPDGSEHAANSGAPAVLCAFGEHNVRALQTCSLEGVTITGWREAA